MAGTTKGKRTAEPKKVLHRRNLLEYLCNPENPFPTRTAMSTEVLGFSDSSIIYKHFSPAELGAIEAEALIERRKNYAAWLARIDHGLMKRAAEGDPAASKLAYQRLEAWSEKQRLEHGVTPEFLQAILDGLPEDYRRKVLEKMMGVVG